MSPTTVLPHARARSTSPARPLDRSRPRLVRRVRRLLARDLAVPLTAALGLPAMAAVVAVDRPASAPLALGVWAVAVGLQALLARVHRRGALMRARDLRLVQLMIGLLLAAAVVELVLPASLALYVPVVALAAAVGRREGLVVGVTAGVLFLVLPLTRAGPVDPGVVSRGASGAVATILIAFGARYYVGRRDAATRRLRASVRRERRRSRQLSGIEEVGRFLATSGPTHEALARVMEVLVLHFGYRYPSIYLLRDDGVLELGAQRGYAAPIESFDGTRGVIGRVLRERIPALVPDVTTDPDYVAASAGIVSQVSAPLLDDGRVLGILNVESVGSLDESDLAAVAAIANRLSAYLALAAERRRLAELTIRDPLTNLYNRRYLDDAIARLFAARNRIAPAERRSLAIALFDLDLFGALNKDHGHALGDEVLRLVARQLADGFRASDLLARYGGEEFVVVLEGATLDEAARRAESVRGAVAGSVTLATGSRVHVTLSAGCAALSSDASGSWRELLAAADVALGMAKRGGRDQVVCASL